MSPLIRLSLFLVLLTSQSAIAAGAMCSDFFSSEQVSELWVPQTPSRNLSQSEKSEIKKWIKLNTNQDGYLKIRPLVSDAPEMVLYNWMSAATGITNVTDGISRENVKKIMAKEDKQHEGIYLSADPIDTSHFGNVLTEVVVYKRQYPLKKESGIQWFDIQSSQFGLDPYGRSGNGVRFFKDSLAKNDFVVKDPRVIKELRFPSKQMINKFWQQANFYEQGPLLLQQMRVAEQWLLTPNFSAKERGEIFENAPEHFADYLNKDGDFQIPYLKYKSAQADYIKLNGILQALTALQEDFVNPETGVVNYPLFLAGVEKLSEKKMAELEFLRKNIQEGRLVRLILDLGLSYREKNERLFKQTAEALRTRIENQSEDSKKYLAFRKETLFEQLFLIELISK